MPVAITVEGANLLTRSLIIFGQGAIRCHPFVLREMNAARDKDKRRGLKEFDAALFGHIGFTISNAVRSLVMALTLARFSRVPEPGPTQRFFQHINRFSASFAFATDVAMLTLGGYLKKKESLSARLGDVLSCMYLASMVLKHYENQGRPEEDLPLVEWACRTLAVQGAGAAAQLPAQLPESFPRSVHALLHFPARPDVSRTERSARPRGRRADAAHRRVTRDRLTHGVYRTVEPRNPLGLLHEALVLADTAEPLEKRIRVEGVKTGKHHRARSPGQIQQALAAGILSETEAAMLRDYDRRVMEIIHVDDFTTEEMAAGERPDRRQSARRASATPESQLSLPRSNRPVRSIQMKRLDAMSLSSQHSRSRSLDRSGYAHDRRRRAPRCISLLRRTATTVTSPVTVRFGLKGMGIAPAGIAFDNSGHHHLIVDADAAALDAPDPGRCAALHFGKGQTETTVELKPGKHTLQLVLGDQLHMPHRAGRGLEEDHDHGEVETAQGAARAPSQPWLRPCSAPSSTSTWTRSTRPWRSSTIPSCAASR